MEEYGCNCSFDSAGNPVDWCSFHEALRDSLAEKDREIERLRNSHEMKFVRHIEAHLSAYQVPICKICGKDIFEISEEDSDGKL